MRALRVGVAILFSSCFPATGPGQFYRCAPDNSCNLTDSICQDGWCVPMSCSTDSDCGPVACINNHCGCQNDGDCPGSTCTNGVCAGPDSGTPDGGTPPDAGGGRDGGCTGCWQPLASMNTPRTNEAGAAANGVFYVFSGLASGGTTASAEAYSPATGTWSTLMPVPTGRCYATAAAVGAHVFFQGGCPGCDCSNGAVDENDDFDTSSGTWQTSSAMPTPRAFAATASIGGNVYVAGGTTRCPPCSPTNVLEVFHPSTGTRTNGAPLPQGVLGAAAAEDSQGNLVVLGGLDGGLVDNVYLYNLGTDTWSSGVALPSPTAELSAVNFNGSIYAVGGEGTSMTCGTQVLIEAPGAPSWSSGPTLPGGSCLAALAVLGSDLYAVTPPNTFTPSASLYLYVP